MAGRRPFEPVILCVRCRAARERAEPGRWNWTEAPAGLRCEATDCDRPADAAGTPKRKTSAATLACQRRYYAKNKARIAEGRAVKRKMEAMA